MEKIIPKVDIAFKKIFGVEENKDLLISLVNSIVSSEDQVADLTLLNPYNPKNFKNDKLSILDIKAKGIDGKMFNIEIQIADEADYDKRALYYWAKLYTEQLKAAEDYSNLAKAIGIHILNFTSVPESDKYHNVFNITEKDNGSIYFKDLELHTIELRKFSDKVGDDITDLIKKVKSSLDIWVAFLTKYNLLNKENLPSELTAVPLEKALSVMEVMNFSDQERDEYESHLKWLRIQTGTVNKYKREGIAIGEARGEARGEAKAVARTALNMLRQKLDDKIICQVTGLSEDDLLKLKNQL